MRRGHFIRLAAVSDDAVGSQAKAARRRQQAVTTVPEGVAIADYRKRRLRGQQIGDDDIERSGMVNVHDKNYGRGLGEAVNDFVAGSELHEKYLV